MTLRHKVTIASVTPRGEEPQFFGTFARLTDANAYAALFSELEDQGAARVTIRHEITPDDMVARAGVLIRVDRDEVVDRRER